jgi:uncharacterized membrane protein YhaH (DUF805 family)
MDWQSLFFSSRGRINRAKYWLAMLVFLIVGVVFGLAGWLFHGLLGGVPFRILSFVVDVAMFVAGIAVWVKRLHDRDRSAWWLLLFYFGPVGLVLIGAFTFWAAAGAVGEAADYASLLLRLCLLGGFALAVWAFVETGCLRGTVGYNRFGPDPLGLRRRSVQT